MDKISVLFPRQEQSAENCVMTDIKTLLQFQKRDIESGQKSVLTETKKKNRSRIVIAIFKDNVSIFFIKGQKYSLVQSIT